MKFLIHWLQRSRSIIKKWLQSSNFLFQWIFDNNKLLKCLLNGKPFYLCSCFIWNYKTPSWIGICVIELWVLFLIKCLLFVAFLLLFWIQTCSWNSRTVSIFLIVYSYKINIIIADPTFFLFILWTVLLLRMENKVRLLLFLSKPLIIVTLFLVGLTLSSWCCSAT